MAEKKSLILYYEYEKQFALLSDSQLGRLIRSMLDFEIYGEVPDFSDDPALEMTFSFISAQLERDKSKYEQKCAVNAANGKKGGRPSKQSVSDKTRRFSNKPKKADEDKEEDKEEDNEEVKDIKPTRHKYGEYKNVLLSDDEIEKLKIEIPDYQSYIERLSGYMASSGRTYKNYLATIRNWARKDGEKDRTTDNTPSISAEDGVHL